MRQAKAIEWFKHDITHRGITAWITAACLFLFYVLLYFGDRLNRVTFNSFFSWSMLLLLVLITGTGLFLANQPEEEKKELLLMTAKIDLFLLFVYAIPWCHKWLNVPNDIINVWARSIPIQHFDKWMLYGTAYTFLITGFGIYVIRKYKNNRYQIVRTSVVIFVQATFAYSIPYLLKLFKQPGYYFSYIWPLKLDYFSPYHIMNDPMPFVIYSLLAGIVFAPLLAVFFGKRWYCSWVCGCGGLANTFGEPWRHLSSTSSRAWKLEKFTIHFTLLITLLATLFSFMGGLLPKTPDTHNFHQFHTIFKEYYGSIVVCVLSGIVGVGLYPIGGTRLWCRFACPMAALLGLIQKFGRFRIRVKKDMCISCGMCSKYCEMGIDVRSYAQNNQDFTRASCVGCGLCSEVCPRGVLRLENVSRQDPQELALEAIQESWKRESNASPSRK